MKVCTNEVANETFVSAVDDMFSGAAETLVYAGDICAGDISGGTEDISARIFRR